jgi:hypothetical protein
MTQPRPAPHIIRWFLRATGFAGITLPPLGIYILAERIHDSRLIRHELAHWAQAQRMGIVRWAITYLFYNVRYGYWDNPLEVEARAAELKG